MGLTSQLLFGIRQPQNRKENNASMVKPEEEFHAAVRRECRRTERSGKPFLLMLASFEGMRGSDNGQGAPGEFSRVLVESSRETDIVGWHRYGRALGVIFTELSSVKELGAKDKAEIVNAITQRMSCLRDAKWKGQTPFQINFSFHFFPEDPSSSSTARAAHLSAGLEKTKESKPMAQGIKRMIDLIGASLGLVLLSPLFLAVGTLIRLTSRGPALFRQIRVGLHGTQFTFIKFRSMYVNNEAGLHKEYVSRFIKGKVRQTQSANGKAAAYKIIDDPRVTPLGRLLRKTSIDELPQLLNVLKGEMSLVGPRPPLPYECECYEIWHRRRVTEVKPGITGLWQVCGRSKTSFDEMVRLDLRYARTWSLWLDCKILLRTFRTVFSGDGAY